MQKINQTPQVVTIAGSDSGGGAGMQADLKTFQARKVFGMNIVLALTAQNTRGVQESMTVTPEFITAQFTSLAADFQIRACKTGMLADEKRIHSVVENLQQVNFGPLVVDPVMIAKGGHSLLEDSAISSIKKDLLPLATLVTPNIPEAAALTGFSIANEEQMKQAAYMLQDLGVKNVLIKGGHRTGERASDFLLLENQETYWLHAPRIQTKRTHGTGDTLSAAIVAELAKGKTLTQAIYIAKCFLQGAISNEIQVGQGHGPLNHWAKLATDVWLEQS